MSMEDVMTESVQERESQGPREVEDEFEVDLHYHDKRCRKNPKHRNFIPIDQFNVDHLPPGCQDNDLVDLVRAVADLTVQLTVKYVSEKRPETYPGKDKPYPMYNKRGSNTKTVGTGCVSRVKKYPYKLDNKDCEECLNSPLPKISDCKEHLSSPTLKICDCEECLTSPTPKTCNCKKCFTSPISKTCNCKECLSSPTPKTQFAQIYIYTATHVVFDHLEAAHTTCHLFFDSGARPDLCGGVVTLTEPTSVITDINSDLCHLVFVTHDLELADKLESMVEQCRRSHLKSSINNKNILLDCKESNSSPEAEFDDLYKRSTFFSNSDSLLRMHFPLVCGIQNNATNGQSLPDIIEDQMRCAKHFLEQTRSMNDESGKQISQLVAKSVSDIVGDLMGPLKDLLDQGSGVNVESDKQISQPVVESGLVEEIHHPLNDFLDQRSGVNVESEKQSHQHEAADSMCDSTEEIMHSLKHFYDQRSGMHVVDKQIVESMVEFTSDIFVKIVQPVIHLLSHRSSMNVDSKKQVLQSVLESISDVVVTINHFWGTLYDQLSSVNAESENQIPELVVESASDLVEEIMRPLKGLLDHRSRGNVESEKQSHPYEAADSMCDSIEEIMHSLKHIYDQRGGMHVVDKQIVESMVEFTSDIFVKIAQPVIHLLSHRSSMDVDSKEQVLQSMLESTSDVIEKINHFVESIYDLRNSVNVESEKQIQQPVVESASSLVEDIMSPLNDLLSQISGVNVESEKQIQQPVAESASSLVEDIMSPLNDLLSQISGVNVESEKKSYRDEAAEAQGDSLKEAMDPLKHFYDQGSGMNLFSTQCPTLGAGKLSLQQTEIESRLDCLEEAMHSLRHFYDQRSGVNEVDKQFLESAVESTSHVLPNIIYPVRHLLSQGTNMNVESAQQVLQSLIEGSSDFLEKTIQSWTNIHDQRSSTNTDSEKPIFRFDVPLACDGFKDLLRICKNSSYDKDLTSHDSETLCDVAGKLTLSFKPAFEKARNQNIESEKLRSQPQAAPWLTLTIIVSHPHGCSKHVTIGQYTNCEGRNDVTSKFKYTTPTCPGSSGARVCVVGRDPKYLFPHHVHSGGGSQIKQENFSAFGVDIPLD